EDACGAWARGTAPITEPARPRAHLAHLQPLGTLAVATAQAYPSHHASRRPPAYERPPNSVVTEPSSKTSRIARASRGAMDSCVIFASCFSFGTGSVFVTTTSLILLWYSLSVAGSDRIGWVTATMTSAAPASKSTSAAPMMVPP